MSYERKYLKYKVKYLKLHLLEKQQNLIGGSFDEVILPMDNDKIKIGDVLEINQNKESENCINLSNDENNKIFSRNVFVKKGRVIEISSNELINGYKSNINNSQDDIVYDKNAGITLEDDNKNKTTYYYNNFTHNGLKEAQIPFFKINDENNKFEKEFLVIKEQIGILEKKINNIEYKLDNHYHNMPTSGMKQFEKSHPYYGKKID